MWSVASFTVTPDTCTGSSCANGIMWPVRPTFQATRSSTVVAVLGANFQAIAPRGSRPTTPSWRLQLEVVDLHHHAVDLEVEPVAPLLPRVAGGHHGVEVVVHLDVRVHAEAVLAQPLERLGLGGELDPLVRADASRPTSTAGARR